MVIDDSINYLIDNTAASYISRKNNVRLIDKSIKWLTDCYLFNKIKRSYNNRTFRTLNQ